MISDSEYYEEVDKKFAEIKEEYINYYQSFGGFDTEDGKKVVRYTNCLNNRHVMVYLENGILKPFFGDEE